MRSHFRISLPSPPHGNFSTPKAFLHFSCIDLPTARLQVPYISYTESPDEAAVLKINKKIHGKQSQVIPQSPKMLCMYPLSGKPKINILPTSRLNSGIDSTNSSLLLDPVHAPHPARGQLGVMYMLPIQREDSLVMYMLHPFGNLDSVGFRARTPFPSRLTCPRALVPGYCARFT